MRNDLIAGWLNEMGNWTADRIEPILSDPSAEPEKREAARLLTAALSDATDESGIPVSTIAVEQIRWLTDPKARMAMEAADRAIATLGLTDQERTFAVYQAMMIRLGALRAAASHGVRQVAIVAAIRYALITEEQYPIKRD